MSKKSDELLTTLDTCYLEQNEIYQEIMAQCIDLNRISVLLRQLEANSVRRQNTQRQLDSEIIKGDWLSRVLNQ